MIFSRVISFFLAHPSESCYAGAINVAFGEGRSLDIQIKDFSRRGVSFDCDADLPLGSRTTIRLAGTGWAEATIVGRIGKAYAGEFAAPLSASSFAFALALKSMVLMTAEVAPVTCEKVCINRYPIAVRALLLVVGAVVAWAVAGYLIYAMLT